MTRKVCPGCEEKDTIYSLHGKEKCINCDWRWDPDKIAHEYPTRASDAKCGDVLGCSSDGVSNPIVRKRMCNDGSHCSITASGIEEVEDGAYIVICGVHASE